MFNFSRSPCPGHAGQSGRDWCIVPYRDEAYGKEFRVECKRPKHYYSLGEAGQVNDGRMTNTVSTGVRDGTTPAENTTCRIECNASDRLCEFQFP